MLQLRLKSLISLMVAALTLVLAQLPVEAQEPPVDHPLYLPLIVSSGDANAPSGPYAQMLARVQQMCSATGLNQVCYANGQVVLQPKTGAIPFAQPGAIVDLANVQSLSLTWSGADPQQWSLAWLRLAAGSAAPGQTLTILAFGNVEINNIIPLTGQIDPDDETTLPSLDFASSPVAGVTEWGSSGLIVTNPTEEEALSLTLNGAVISLASTALVEARPGSQMNVTMAAGVSVTEASGQSSVAVQGHQVSLPLNQTGHVSGPPTQAIGVDPLLDMIFLDDLLTPLTNSGWQSLAGSLLTRLNRAIDRCIAGQPAYVYNVLFWSRIIGHDSYVSEQLRTHLNPAQLAQAYNRAPRCLNFEVDFDSSVTSTATQLTQSSHLHTQGLRLQFGPTGNFLSGGNQPLVYLSYEYDAPPGGCPRSTQTSDGRLETVGGSLTIAGNGLRLTTLIRVSPQPHDAVVHHCPPPAGTIVLPQDHWTAGFYYMHGDLVQPADPHSFDFRNWRHTGGEHFGEAIYVRTGAEAEFTFNTTTYLIMVHTPLP